MFCKYFIQNDIKRSSFLEYSQSQVLLFYMCKCCICNLSRWYSVTFDIKFENQCTLLQNYSKQFEMEFVRKVKKYKIPAWF